MEAEETRGSEVVFYQFRARPYSALSVPGMYEWARLEEIYIERVGGVNEKPCNYCQREMRQNLVCKARASW